MEIIYSRGIVPNLIAKISVDGWCSVTVDDVEGGTLYFGLIQA
jgi:hypothetical protein